MKFTSNIPKARSFAVLKYVHTDCEAYSVSYSFGIVSSFQMIERPVRDADIQPHLVSKLTKCGGIIRSRYITD
jgi:hypothetical protein